MKICHCIKLTKEENDALHTVISILEEWDNDYMLSHDFEDEDGMSPGDICFHLKDATAYLERWQ